MPVIRLQGRNPATGTWWYHQHKLCWYWKTRRGKFRHWHVEW
jgi:hypothetical protein